MAMIALLVTTASAGPAPCCGDCAGDGRVTIEDLIRAVNNALLGCGEETATPRPTATATRTPTPTRTPADRCPSTFATRGNNLCLFRGTYNRGCGSEVNSTFSSDGSLVLVTIATGLAVPPVTVGFTASITQPTSATLTGWSSDDFRTVHPVAGAVRLNDDGRQLEVFPNSPPFSIQSCQFVQYLGAYQRPRSAAIAAELATRAPCPPAATDPTPIPDLARE